MLDQRETGGLRLREPFVEDVDQSNGNVGFEGMPAKRIAEQWRLAAWVDRAVVR
jgi:hypothetical protein